MPTSQYMPDAIVEVAWTSGYLTPAASRVWTDISADVEAQEGVDIRRGRQDELSQVQTATCQLTLDNRTGKYTAENTGSPNYPNVKKGRPLRVRVRPPLGQTLPAVVTDTFTAADSTTSVWTNPTGRVADSGQSWYQATTTGTWGISSNKAYPSSATAAPLLIDGGYRVQDPAFQVDFTTSATLASSGGVLFRYVDALNYLRLTASASGWVLTDVQGGGPSVIATAGSCAASTTYTLRIECVLANVKVWVNGSLIIDVNVADFLSATVVGFYPSGVTDTRYDNVSVAPATSVRFTGYVDDWPTEWPDGTQSRALASISASSRAARLGLGTELRSIIEESWGQRFNSPVAPGWTRALHFPLGEAAGATQYGNIAPNRSDVLVQTQRGTGGTLVNAQATGPPTDGLSCPVFTPASSANGITLLSTFNTSLPSTSSGATTKKLSMLLAFATNTATPGTNTQYLAVLYDAITSSYFAISLDTTGVTNQIIVQVVQGGTTYALSVPAGAGSVRDGNVHLVYASVLLTNGTNATDGKVQLLCNVDSTTTQYATATTSGWSNTDPSGVVSFPDYKYLEVGGAPSGGLFTGSIAHVAVFTGGPITDATATSDLGQWLNAAKTGFPGDSSNARIARLAGYAAVPTAEQTLDTGLSTNLAYQDTTGKTPLALMQDVAETEDGVLFDGRDGSLTFHGRGRRYTSVSAFTLDRNQGELEEGLRPVLDDQGMVNDMTAERTGGVRIRSTRDDSITEYGYYRETKTLVTAVDNEVQARADWEVQRRGIPRVRFPTVNIDVLSMTAAKLAAVLQADIGTRFTLANLPSQAPGTTVDLFLEGCNEHIGAEEYTMSWNTSSVAYAVVWLLDSATASQLDSTTILAY